MRALTADVLALATAAVGLTALAAAAR